MKLNDFLNKTNCETKLININEAFANAKTHVTFWGTRVITVEGYEGSFSLHMFTKMLKEAAYKRLVNDDYTAQERVAGMEILKKLNTIYTDSDTQIKTKGLFTRIFSVVQDILFASAGVKREIIGNYVIAVEARYQNQGLIKKSFVSCSEKVMNEQYRKVALAQFGFELPKGTGVNGETRWYINEEYIHKVSKGESLGCDIFRSILM